jgi:DNA invertase Pin-like site-specific DNA recombinase
MIRLTITLDTSLQPGPAAHKAQQALLSAGLPVYALKAVTLGKAGGPRVHSHEAMRALRRKGKSLREIAEGMGCSEATVSRACKGVV